MNFEHRHGMSGSVDMCVCGYAWSIQEASMTLILYWIDIIQKSKKKWCIYQTYIVTCVKCYVEIEIRSKSGWL